MLDPLAARRSSFDLPDDAEGGRDGLPGLAPGPECRNPNRCAAAADAL